MEGRGGKHIVLLWMASKPVYGFFHCTNMTLGGGSAGSALVAFNNVLKGRSCASLAAQDLI